MVDQRQQQQQNPAVSSGTRNEEGNKRKLDEEIQLAKQKAQEIAARFLSDADSKRPRLLHDDEPYFSKPSAHSTPFPIPPLPDNVQKFPSQLIANSQVGSVPLGATSGQYHSSQGSSKIMTIPNSKVGVVIGKGGETIKHLQLQSGAKIQITKDLDADPYAQTRDVELMGTMDQINRVEQLINNVIKESDDGNSVPSDSMQPGSEQFIMKVPNNKVASLIGKGGETIRNIQSRSGARIQIIPLHLPPGDTSMERNVYINGQKEQIELAKELINEAIVVNRLRNLYGTSNYVQPGYPPPGSWGPPGQPPMQQHPGYGYGQPGPCFAPPQYYGGYPTQAAGSDQSNPSPVPPPPQSTGYNYYGQQGEMGSAPPNPSYSQCQAQPISSQSYDQRFSQQPLSYGQDISIQAPSLDQQKPYVYPGYGPTAISSQPDGTTPNQSTQSPGYPLGYNPPVATSQAWYRTAPTYTGPALAYSGYDPMGYTHTGYGVQQPVQLSPLTSQTAYGQSGSYPSQPVTASQPVYGSGSFLPHPSPAPTSSDRGTIPPADGQPPGPPLQPQPLQPQPDSESTANEHLQPLVEGAEVTGDRNTASAYVTAPVVPETVSSES